MELFGRLEGAAETADESNHPETEPKPRSTQIPSQYVAPLPDEVTRASVVHQTSSALDGLARQEPESGAKEIAAGSSDQW